MKRCGRTFRVKEADLKSLFQLYDMEKAKKSEKVDGYQRLRGKEGWIKGAQGILR